MNGIIKIGRIGKKAEEAMGVSIANDTSIYVLDATLDDLARRYPTSYLSILSEIKDMIKKPDAFFHGNGGGDLSYLRLHPKDNELFLLIARVSLKGVPKKYVLSSFTATKDLSSLIGKEGQVFCRL